MTPEELIKSYEGYASLLSQALRELIAAREAIKAKDAEIARLNDRIEAFSLDLAIKDGKVKCD